MPIAAPRLIPESLADKVTSSVRQMILAGDLKPGSDFSITELAAALGVSSIPVREALQRLEAQGLIHLRRSRTVVVAPISTTELREIYDLRILIEGDIARQAATRYTDDAIAALKLHLDSMPGLSPTDDQFWAHHGEFHQILLAPAMSPWRDRMLRQLWHAAERYVRLVYSEVGFNREAEPYAGHFPLYEAATRRSGADLKRALGKHFEDNVTWMLNGLASIKPDIA
jgi:DNA-binding GntR family transcriptional regulator